MPATIVTHVREDVARRDQPPIDSGRGDVPLRDLRFGGTGCCSRRADNLTMAKDVLGVQPWQQGKARRVATRGLSGPLDPAHRAPGHPTRN